MKAKKDKKEVKSQDTKKPQQIINYTLGKGAKVRLRGKRLSDGAISLYFDYYQGYKKDSVGKVTTNRKIEYLKLYIKDKPKTDIERGQNKETFELANKIRAKRESDISHGKEGFISPQKKKINFFDYCQSYLETYTKKDIRVIEQSVKQFKEYTKETFLSPNDIETNTKLLTGFMDYLKAKYKGETPKTIFARFKKILIAATKEGYFSKNPASELTIKAPNGINKEILMPDEIQTIVNTECSNIDVKRAFLFCLNTGFGFSEVQDLKYKNIANGKVIKRRGKTNEQVIIDLNRNALKLIGNMGEPEQNIFVLPSFSYCIRVLKEWIKQAGINRNITWHSARHSFCTILLMNKNDIKTVSSLMGHGRLEHTQKYSHLVSELAKQAVEGIREYSENI